jgi:putative transposase
MSRPKQHPVSLNNEQHDQLNKLLSKGEANARVLTRARILLLAHKQWFDKDVAEALQVSASTVMNVRKRFGAGGLDAALYDKPRPGAVRKLDGKQEALLVALACSQPDERETWTMQLLADKLVELNVVDEISDETVRRTLKKTRSSRGRRSSGALAG